VKGSDEAKAQMAKVREFQKWKRDDGLSNHPVRDFR